MRKYVLRSDETRVDAYYRIVGEENLADKAFLSYASVQPKEKRKLNYIWAQLVKQDEARKPK